MGILFAIISLLVLLAALIILLQDLRIVPALLMEISGKLPDGVEQSRHFVEPGVTLECWKYGHEGVPLLFLHGNSDTVETFFEMQRKVADLGFVTYQFDYRGVGASTGWPTEAGLCRDAEVVLEFIAGQQSCSTADIVLVGQSLGSGPTCYLAAKFNSARVLLYTPFVNLPTVVRERRLMRFLAPFVWYRFPNDLRLQHWARQAKGELLLIHSLDDQVIKYAHSLNLITLIKQQTGLNAQVNLIEVPCAAHNQIKEITWNKVSEHLKNWARLDRVS